MSIGPRLRSWIETHGAHVALALGVLTGFWLLIAPVRIVVKWGAVALLLFAGGELVRRFGPGLAERAKLRLSGVLGRGRQLAPYAFVTLVTLWLLGPVALGQMPATQDHASHYLATDIFVKDMIGSGRLFGWTERLGAGYPFGDLYPTLSYLVTGLLHLVTLGRVPLDVSYAFGMTLIWLILALGVARLAHRLANGWAAAFAGIAIAADPGADREGGWGYAMFHGVWTQQLAVGFWVLALLALWRLSERGDTRRLALAGLLCGMSLLTHPINSVCLLVAGALMFAVRLLGVPDNPSRGALRLVAALGLGGVMGLPLVSRMLLHGDEVRSIWVYWTPLVELMGQTLTFSLFEHQLAPVAVLATIGACHALFGRNLFALCLLLAALALLVIGSMDAVVGFDLGLLGGTFRVLQYRRFAIPVKCIWYAFAGVGLWVVGRGILSVAREATQAWAPRGLRLLSSVVLAPVVLSLIWALPRMHEAPTARALTLKRAGEAEHVAAIRALLEKERTQLTPGSVPRAVYIERHGQGGRYPTLSIVDAGYGLLPNLFVPAQNFSSLAHTESKEVMHRLGASFFITRWPANHKLLEPAGQFGTHHVYRFVKPLPPAVQVEGPGRADIVRWSDEERIFKVSDTTAESRLVLAMSPYPKWHAYQGDQKLSLSARNVGSVPLVMVSGLTNGELRLVYRDTPAEKAAGIAGLLAFLLCAVGLVVRPRSIVRLPPERTLRRVYLGLSIATLGSLLALPLVANLAGRRGQRAEWLAAEPAGAAIEDVLHQRLPDALSHHPALYCVEPYSRSPGWDCTESELRPVLSAADARGNRVPSCLLLGVPPAGRTVVGYDMPGSPNVLVGRLDNTGEGAGIIGSLTFDDKHSPAILIAGKRFRANVPPGTRRASITLENASRSASQICLELVSLAGGRPSPE